MPKPEHISIPSAPVADLSEREQAEQVEKIKAGLKAAEEGRFVNDSDIDAIIRKFEMNA